MDRTTREALIGLKEALKRLDIKSRNTLFDNDEFKEIRIRFFKHGGQWKIRQKHLDDYIREISSYTF